MRVLLIVDVQNDFMPGGALAVPQGDQIIPIINTLQHIFPLVVATKDLHPPNHCSFASNHKKKAGEIVEQRGIQQELWPDHCVINTLGAEFASGLKTTKINRIFFKGVDPLIDSYSAFFDNAHLHSTGLYEYFQQQKVDEVFIVGLATDYCIKYSVLDALRLGLKVKVIEDGCKGIDLNPGDTQNAIEEIKGAGATITKSFHVLALASQN